jgi:hypothetical protein
MVITIIIILLKSKLLLRVKKNNVGVCDLHWLRRYSEKEIHNNNNNNNNNNKGYTRKLELLCEKKSRLHEICLKLCLHYYSVPTKVNQLYFHCRCVT